MTRRLARRLPISRPTGRASTKSRPITGAFAQRIDELLDQAPEQIIHVALEHRLMHAETLAYLLHNLPYDQKAHRAAAAHSPCASRLPNPMIEIAPGIATLGQKPGEFGWDNEFAEHQVNVPGFRVSKYKITNGQYLDFVRDGRAGPALLDPARRSLVSIAVCSPKSRLPLNAPVYVTHAEAIAYARWAGKKLPTEAQFHRAAYSEHR